SNLLLAASRRRKEGGGGPFGDLASDPTPGRAGLVAAPHRWRAPPLAQHGRGGPGCGRAARLSPPSGSLAAGAVAGTAGSGRSAASAGFAGARRVAPGGLPRLPCRLLCALASSGSCPPRATRCLPLRDGPRRAGAVRLGGVRRLFGRRRHQSLPLQPAALLLAPRPLV